MKKKSMKIASIVMMAIIALVIMRHDSVDAANQVVLEASTVQGYEGDTVTVKVALKENPGIAALKFRVQYDSAVLSVVNDEDEDALISTGVLAAPVVNNKASEATVVYAYASEKDSKETGDVLTISFKINDGATIGNSTINIEVVEIFNDEYEDVEYADTDGSVKVMCKHTETEENVTKAATCTEEGTKTTVCKKCLEVLSTDKIDALGHKLGAYTETKAPTCTEAGESTAKCERCDYTEKKAVDALGHKLGAYTETKAPTCTEAGESIAKCEKCDYTEKKAIAALGHMFDEFKITNDATATEDGELVKICSVCKDEVKETIKALEKVLDDVVVKDIANNPLKGEYSLDEQIKFIVVGGYMNNTNPQVGDMRYVPTQWKLVKSEQARVASNNGTWDKAPYEGEFVVDTVGEYELQVVLTREIFADGQWVADDVNVTKSTTFTVAEKATEPETTTEPEKATEAETTTEAIKPVPDTSDSSTGMLIILALVSVMSAGVFTVARKKIA